MNDPTPTNTESNEPTPRTAPIFSPRTLRTQLLIDSSMRFGVLALILSGIVLIGLTPALGTILTAVAVIGIIAVWLWVSTINAQVTSQLDRVLMVMEEDKSDAEDMLVMLMGKRGLLRWVRLVLYQRLALLRHRQQRFAEAAAIAEHVLVHPMGPVESVRGNLILLMVESHLKTGTLYRAYLGLATLAAMPLSLFEQMQKLALQTQYEVSLGYDHAALADAENKIALAELMPSTQCGAWHATLATAAQRTQQHDLADWLRRRAQLLCAPEQWEQLNVAGMHESALG